MKKKNMTELMVRTYLERKDKDKGKEKKKAHPSPTPAQQRQNNPKLSSEPTFWWGEKRETCEATQLK